MPTMLNSDGVSHGMSQSAEPFGESHFPRQMSWYAPESPRGPMRSAARWVRENPWLAIGSAVLVGALAGALIGRRRHCDDACSR